MSQSPTSQHRARMIRQLSHDLNQTRSTNTLKEFTVNTESTTTSGFDPENEAVMSTRQIDNSQRLPELRASAQKYARYSKPEPDFAINTSAIGRAFPDFTQGGEISDRSMSIELGRGLGNGGAKGKGRSKDQSFNEEFKIREDSMDFSPAMIGKYQSVSTPPKQSAPSSKKTGGAGSVRRDAQIRRASAAQKQSTEQPLPGAKVADYGSAGSRQSSAEDRRTLATLHARVTDEDDGSRISDERPATLNLTARSTRFNNGQGPKSNKNTLPTKFSSTKDFVQAVSHVTAPDQQNIPSSNNNATVSSINHVTQQSFMLPDLPNISELVSGVFQDGTPVFSRHGKARTSRFTSNSHAKPEYAGISGIPIPEDEQAIFVSLRLLQDKVADLEHNRAEAQATIIDLQERNRVLEQEQFEAKRLRRSDSALGTTDGSDGSGDGGRGSRKSAIEISRLQSTIRALHEKAESSTRRISVAEITIKNLTQERDSAAAQLGVAYFTTEELKAENERLTEENKQLVAQLKQWATQHSDKRSIGDRSSKYNHQTNIASTQENITTTSGERLNHDETTDHRYTGMHRKESKTESKSKVPSKSKAPATIADGIDMQKKKKTRMVIQEYSDSESSEASFEGTANKENHYMPQTAARSETANSAAGDITYLSFIDNNEIAKIRRTLELERLARKGQPSKNGRSSKPTEDTTQTGQSRNNMLPRETILPRKSSMKDLTGRISVKADNAVHNEIEDTILSKASKVSNTRRRHSEDSLLEHQNKRRGVPMDDLTSAFILPDFTLRVPGVNRDATQNLSAAAQQVFDGLAKHDGHNCTICKRVIEHGSSHTHEHKPSKETVTIPKPIPVTERMSKPTPYEEEPTLRPSQPPADALAIVLKGLEDELAHLKLQLAQYQALYNQHDPSLSKRKRKSVLTKIENTLQTIDVKADQIYALYDVLEGQKADGHEMNGQEIEVTLQSIGIDLSQLGLRGGDAVSEVASKQKKQQVWEMDSSDGSEEDLPWEGIEPTVDTTGPSFAVGRRSSWGI